MVTITTVGDTGDPNISFPLSTVTYSVTNLVMENPTSPSNHIAGILGAVGALIMMLIIVIVIILAVVTLRKKREGTRKRQQELHGR